MEHSAVNSEFAQAIDDSYLENFRRHSRTGKYGVHAKSNLSAHATLTEGRENESEKIKQWVEPIPNAENSGIADCYSPAHLLTSAIF